MSIDWEILDAVRSRLQALDLASSPTVVIRKRLVRFRADPANMLLIAPGRDGEDPAGGTFNRRPGWRYPVAVALVTAGNSTVEAGLPDYLDDRQKIRDALFAAPLPGVIPARGGRVNPGEAVDLALALQSSHDVAGFLVYYQATGPLGEA